MTRAQIQAFLSSLIGDDPTLIDSIYNDYLTTATTCRADLQCAIAAYDIEAARRAAHTLKGCSANVGAEDAQMTCLAIETAVKAGDFDTARMHAAQLNALFKTLEQES